MTNSQGFWSYVHDDDQAEDGRISRLVNDIATQYEMISGEKITLFLDKQDLKWGENWHDKVDSNLESVVFFIPVLSPRYFMSPECRHELRYFANRATQLGIKELILPLLYIDVPSINNENPTDELIALVKTFQWEDWRDLRFLEVVSEGYRRGVAQLAYRLVEANRHLEEMPTVIMPRAEDETPDGYIDDSPGYIDRLATSEEAMPRMQAILEEIAQNIVLTGQIMADGTEDIQRANSQGKGFAARIIVSRTIASKLSEPAERILLLSNEFASQLNNVDEGFRVIIELAPAQIDNDPDSKTNFCAYFETIRNLSATAHEAMESGQKMIDSIEPVERMSRDLRPVLRKLRQGLTIMVESRQVSDEWIHLIECSGVVCESTDL
jgi:hypothetical protein